MVAQIDKEMIRLRPFKLLGRVVAWALIEGRPLTTRGRWINRAVFAGYRIAQIIPQTQFANRPIYIVGAGRSGTTVLGKVFSVHRETVFLNEPKALWNYAHGGEDIVGSYTLAPARMRLRAAEATDLMARRIARIYSTAIRVGCAKRVVDKYPELIFRIPFVQALFAKACFVGILRDGVDTCASVDSWSRLHGRQDKGHEQDWWGLNGRKWHMIVDQLVPEHADLAPLKERLHATVEQCDRAAVEWILATRETLRAAQNNPQVLLVRYEELCAEPHAVLEQVRAHCDLGADPTFMAYAQRVLKPKRAHPGIDLMPELVDPFRQVLEEAGYGASRSRVLPRGA